MRKLIRKYRLPLLFVFGTMLYFVANLQRVSIPGAVFNELQMKWSLTASQVTSFGACFMYVYAVSQLFVGYYSDRCGGSRVMFAGGALLAAGSFLFALCDSYPVLCFARGLTGLGASAFYLGLVSEVIRCFKKSYSIIISVIVMSGYMGGIVANAPFSFAVSQTSLRSTLIGVAVFSLICYLLYLIPFRSIRKPAVRNTAFAYKNFLPVFRKRHNWYIFVFHGVNWGLYYSFQTVIGKKFLEDYCKMSTGWAAIVFSGVGVISAVAGLVYAIGSRKLGNRRKPFCLLTGSMTLFVFLTLTLLTAFDCRNIIPAVLFCCLASTASLSAIVIPLIKETNDSGITGSAIAFSNFSAYILVAIFGNVIGGVLNLFAPEMIDGRLIYSRYAYLTVFCIMTLSAASVLFSACKIRETCGEHITVK